jgi:hypothetical protein
LPFEDVELLIFAHQIAFLFTYDTKLFLVLLEQTEGFELSLANLKLKLGDILPVFFAQFN